MRKRQKISVSFSYPLIFTRDVFDPGNKELLGVFPEKPARVMFLLDSGVARKTKNFTEKIQCWTALHHDSVEPAGPVCIVRGGEQIKNRAEETDRLIELFQKHNMCRHSYVVVIGGGAVLDAVGFAASIVHRGLRQIRIPTTVLSQNDSGVGVKNGINRCGIKNFLGTFNVPDAVINDGLFLTTLSYRDWIAGVAEAFKAGVIKDRSFLRYLKSNCNEIRDRNLEVMEEVVKRCALLHICHISSCADPFERKNCRPLDFGHWAAHRLESLSRNRLRHGEAVAIGMALDLLSAWQLGFIKRADATMVIQAMKSCDLPVWSDLLLEKNREGELKILRGLQEFKEHLGGRLTLTMPKNLGTITEIHDLPLNIIERSINELQMLAGNK